MNYEITAVAGLAVVLIICFVWIIIRDREVKDKLKKFELVLEGLIKENYRLKKELAEELGSPEPEFDIGAIYASLDNKINSDINAKVLPILASIQKIESAIAEFASEQQGRIWSLEERTKTIGHLTPPADKNEDEQIIASYKSGKSIESIARDMRLGVGRVSMVLRMHELV